jgi:hypothetical protein
VRMSWASLVGVALIFIAIVLWGGWTLWDRTRTWFFAKDVPISLSSGSHYSTGVVKANMDALYSIYATSVLKPTDHQLESETELACQIGISDPKVGHCKNPPEWEFRWTLTSDEGRVQGDSSETVGDGSIDLQGIITRNIGEFRTKAGHSYELALDVLFDNRNSRIVDPRLTVTLTDFHAESSLFISGLLNLICPTIALVGVLVVLVPWAIRRRAPSAGGPPFERP